MPEGEPVQTEGSAREEAIREVLRRVGPKVRQRLTVGGQTLDHVEEQSLRPGAPRPRRRPALTPAPHPQRHQDAAAGLIVRFGSYPPDRVAAQELEAVCGVRLSTRTVRTYSRRGGEGSPAADRVAAQAVGGLTLEQVCGPAREGVRALVRGPEVGAADGKSGLNLPPEEIQRRVSDFIQAVRTAGAATPNACDSRAGGRRRSR